MNSQYKWNIECETFLSINRNLQSQTINVNYIVQTVCVRFISFDMSKSFVTDEIGLVLVTYP